LIGVIADQKHGRLALLMNLKKYSPSDVILLQWPTCLLGFRLCSKEYLVVLCSVL